jgi:hypothetical protein
MLVAVQVSSMNTRRLGSRSIWPSNQCWRCFRTSGRSYSIAWPVFFARDPVTHEEPIHRTDPGQGAALDQSRLHLEQGHLSLLGDQFPDEAAVRYDPARMPITTARLGNSPAMLQRKSSPANCARHADPKAGRRCMTAQAAVNRGHNPVPKIL